MNVTLKLYAQLGQYLPENAQKNEVVLDIQEGKTIIGLLTDHGVPAEHCHLVLLDGVYVPSSERNAQTLQDGNHLAVWPPVAGG